MIHKIWHATSAGSFFEIEKQHRVFAGVVECETLDQAWVGSQNAREHWNPGKPCRSTSIGDVIQNDEGYYMAVGMGFRKLDVKEDSEFENMPVITDLHQALNDSFNDGRPISHITF